MTAEELSKIIKLELSKIIEEGGMFVKLRMGVNEYVSHFEENGWIVTEEPEELPRFAYSLHKEGEEMSFNGNVLTRFLYLE